MTEEQFEVVIEILNALNDNLVVLIEEIRENRSTPQPVEVTNPVRTIL